MGYAVFGANTLNRSILRHERWPLYAKAANRIRWDSGYPKSLQPPGEVQQEAAGRKE